MDLKMIERPWKLFEAQVLRGFHLGNFSLPDEEVEHLRLEFSHETRVLKTWDAIIPYCFTNITTNEIVKNLRPNEKKKNLKKSFKHHFIGIT